MIRTAFASVSQAHLRGISDTSTNCRKGIIFTLRRQKSKKRYIYGGEMAEWSIAAVLKTVVRATGPGVRIPLSPQTIALLFRL